MIGSTLAILIALLTQLGLGLAVFLANRHRKSNQAFLLLSLAAAAWLASLYYILTATSLPAAQIGIREASSAGILIIAMLNLCACLSAAATMIGGVFLASRALG